MNAPWIDRVVADPPLKIPSAVSRALCGACRKGYDYDIARNRCAQCKSAGEMLSRAGLLCLLLMLLFVIVVMILARMFHGGSLRSLLRHIVKDHVGGDDGAEISAGVELEALEEINSAIENEEFKKEDGVASTTSEDTQEKRDHFRRSVLTKLKIIVAAWQIASSADVVFRQVRFPAIFTKVTRIFDVAGLAIFDVGSLKCLLGWTYFDKLYFVTLAPFVVVLVAATSYWVIQRHRGKLQMAPDRRKAASDIKYASLLFIFVVLPSISAYVITYFSRTQCRNQV